MKKEDLIAELEKLPPNTEVFLLDVAKELNNQVGQASEPADEMIPAGDGLIEDYQIMDFTDKPLADGITGEKIPWVAIAFNTDIYGCEGNCLTCNKSPLQN